MACIITIARFEYQKVVYGNVRLILYTKQDLLSTPLPDDRCLLDGLHFDVAGV